MRSGCCCGRCSARRRARPPGATPRRSPPSATPASRSTAGGGRARATSRGSAPTSRGRTGPLPTSTACSPASATRRRCSPWRTPCPRRCARPPVPSEWASSRPARAPRRATCGSPYCRTWRRSSTGWPTPSRRSGGPRRTPAASRPRRRSSCAAGPTWTPSRRRCGRATCRSRWWGWAACSTHRRSATWSARCAWWPTRSPGRPPCACSRARAGGWASRTWPRCGRGRGSWHRGRRAAPRRRRPPSWRWARCLASTPSRPAWSTPSTIRGSPAATRRPASPGSGGSRRSCAACGPARRCR